MHCPEGEKVSSSLESFGVDLGDCIGVESCVDLRSDLSFLEKEIISDFGINKRLRDKGLEEETMTMEKEKEKEKEYPPPIPWLARTENLPSHMPWIMKKYQMDDGRLIIREEKVKRHEYFQAHRSNGRLTLRLVPLTDSYLSSSPSSSSDDDVDAEVTMTTENQNQYEKEEIESMPTPPSSSSTDEPCMETCAGSGGDGEYYKSVIRRNSSVLGMALPPFRPVHT